MTDRVKGLVVTLDDDYRIDSLDALLNAIRLFKGVVSVQPVLAEVGDVIIRQRVTAELTEKLWKALE